MYNSRRYGSQYKDKAGGMHNTYPGHVPHRGLFDDARGQLEEKSEGSEAIFATHHDVSTWSNEEAYKNMAPIYITWLVFQLPMGWLNADAY
jgi:hypothetical protein